MSRNIKELLEFIIEQELDLEDYHTMKPLINQHFNIFMRDCGIQSFTEQLINDVIVWENYQHEVNMSLEKLLDDKYLVWLIFPREFKQRKTQSELPIPK